VKSVKLRGWKDPKKIKAGGFLLSTLKVDGARLGKEKEGEGPIQVLNQREGSRTELGVGVWSVISRMEIFFEGEGRLEPTKW